MVQHVFILFFIYDIFVEKLLTNYNNEFIRPISKFYPSPSIGALPMNNCLASPSI